MKNLSKKINAFLEKGHNKLIAQIVDAIVIAVLSVIALYYIVLLVGAPTNIVTDTSTGVEVVIETYLDRIAPNLWKALLFGIIDFAIILFTKPLFGFTSFFENMTAKSKIRKQEKIKEKEEKAMAKARMDAVRAERIAKRKAAKAK